MGHYYEQRSDGKIIPRHLVEMKSRPGELRPTTITDVRKWWKEGRQVVPSVTTILGVLDKAALTNWKIDQHLQQAFAITSDRCAEIRINSSFPDFTVDEFITLTKQRTELEMDKAPSAGTDIHKVLEGFFSLSTLPDNPHEQQIIQNVCVALSECAGAYQWMSEKNFVSNGYGGQVDLSGNGWLIDFKSKQSADKFKPGKMAYDDHRMQLAAYRMGLNMPTARCSNVFICLENGEVDFHEHTEDELSKGWELFKHCLAIWQLQNGA